MRTRRKKLLAFLLSDDVQKTVEPDALGIPVRDQIRTASAESPEPNTPAAVLDGVDVWVPDWNTVLPSSTPMWPHTRRPPVADMAETRVGVGQQQTTAGKVEPAGAGNRQRPQSRSTGSGCPTGAAARRRRR